MVASLEFQAIAIANRLDSSTEDAVRQIVINGVANMQEDCPVDLGWARAGFVPSVGRESDAGGPPGDSPNVSALQAEQTQGLSSVANYSLKDGKAFITNNTPYIQVLNAGSSDQAPAGFVEKALERAVRDANIG